MEISVPFKECPNWLGHLAFSRDGDEIVIEAVRDSGTLLGQVRIPTVQFNQLTDLLLSQGAPDR